MDVVWDLRVLTNEGQLDTYALHRMDSRLYLIFADEAFPGNYQFRGKHAWGLPGVICPNCGSTWGANGVEYPAISAPPELDLKPYRSRLPVTLTRFLELRDELTQVLSMTLPLPPGADFGPLAGTVSGNFGDVCWANWSILVRETTAAALEKEGVRGLRRVPAELHHRATHVGPLAELHIEPRVRLAPECVPLHGLKQCAGCGRFAMYDMRDEMEETIVITGSSLPSDTDIFRVVELPARIVVTETFVRACERLGVTNLAYKQVMVGGQS